MGQSRTTTKPLTSGRSRRPLLGGVLTLALLLSGRLVVRSRKRRRTALAL